MIGTWKWNSVIGLAAMLITFVFSIANNEWLTSLIRSVYGFAIIFAAVYAVRYLLGTVAGLKHYSYEDISSETSQAEETTGSSIHFTTPPDEALLHDLLKQPLAETQGIDGFVPLQPQKLVSKEKLDPVLLAQSLRHMSEE